VSVTYPCLLAKTRLTSKGFLVLRPLKKKRKRIFFLVNLRTKFLALKVKISTREEQFLTERERLSGFKETLREMISDAKKICS